jgi:hypothetical protein
VLIVPGTSKILYHGKSWTKVNYKIDPSIIESNVSGGYVAIHVSLSPRGLLPT